MYKLIITLLLTFTFVNASDSKLTKAELDSLEYELGKLDSYGQSMIQEEIKLTQGYTCYAYATCWDYYGNPYTVTCVSYGSGCTYNAQNGVGVQCTGFNQWGSWNTWWVRC